MNTVVDRRRRSGHMETTIVVWMILIIIAVAAPALVEQATGQMIGELWRGLPQDRTSFVVRSVVGLVTVLLIGGVAAIAGPERPRTSREGDVVVIGIPQPGPKAGGIGLCLLALYCVGSGVVGQGLFWWIVVGIGIVFAGFGLLMAGANERIVVGHDRVQTESRIFRSVTTGDELTVPRSLPAAVAVDEQVTGGTFGKPREVRYSVRLGERELHSVASEVKAEAIREAVARALVEVRDEQG